MYIKFRFEVDDRTKDALKRSAEKAKGALRSIIGSGRKIAGRIYEIIREEVGGVDGSGKGDGKSVH